MITRAPTTSTKPDAPETPTLALRPKEAAAALGISPRLLWQLTNCGRIPHLRLGRAVVYPVAGLAAWLEAEAKGGTR